MPVSYSFRMLRTGQTFAGLRVVGTLGVGEAGESYLVKAPNATAEDILLLLPESRTSDSAYRQEFLAAAAQAATLDHPAVVAVRGYGEEQGRLWIAREYLPSPTAETLVRQSGPFSPAETVAAIAALGGALDQARQRGQARAEIAPADLIVVEAHEGRRYKLSGFGMPAAKESEDRADQVALGDLATFLLTGGASIGQRVTTMRPELPEAVNEVLGRVREPAADRYGSTGEFAAALATALLGDEGTAIVDAVNAPTTVVPSPPAEPTATIPTGPAAPTQPYHSGPQYGVPPQQVNQWGQQPPVAPPPGGQYGAPGYPFAGGQPPAYPGGPGGPGGPDYPGGYQVGPQQPDDGARKRKLAMVIGIGVVAFLLVIGLVLALTLSGGDEDEQKTASSSSATTTSTSRTTTTPTQTNPMVVNGVPTKCVAGAPTMRGTTAYLDGGPIRIDAVDLPPGWNPDPGSQMPFLVDSDGLVVSRPAGENWQAQLLVGSLPASFTGDLDAIARKFMECLSEMPGYANTNAKPAVIENQRESTPNNSDMKLLYFTGKVPVNRGSITSDDFVLLVADTQPRSIALGYSANNDPLSQGEVTKAVQEALVKTR
ncbi:hypothetical protein GCM10023217_19500 [Gordonia alkaliphila]|uniref:Protein kinase domain-containing protein n=2 Tax=Gordonia alkaliphila TaxID=1053547 RepID=A0ABP8Z839_9ACTN